MNVGDSIRDWSARGERLAIATVVETKLSAPQPVGTKMAVCRTGEIAGAVSGGCVEGAVVEVAERIIAGGAPQLLHYGIADEEAWDVGLPCGGEIGIWVDRYDPDGLEAQFEELGRARQRAVLVTTVAGPAGPAGVGERVLVRPDENRENGHRAADSKGLVKVEGSLGELDAAAVELAAEALWTERRALHEIGAWTVFVDVVAPPPRLLIIGAVDFAAQLAAIATLADWRAFVIDPRARFATAARFPAAERVIAAWPQEALALLEPLDWACAVAVLTHDPKLDDAALAAALGSQAGYIGAMGSRRAQDRRRARLLASGFTDAQLDRISAPIGLDLGASSASETALSIIAEIVALRHGRRGGRLTDGQGKIHADVAA